MGFGQRGRGILQYKGFLEIPSVVHSVGSYSVCMAGEGIVWARL